MYYIPELSPLLERTKYETKISFILPLLLDEERTKANRPVTHHIDLKIFLNGDKEPTIVPYEFEDARANHNYSLMLNELLRSRGVDPHREGFFVIESRSIASFTLPSVLKTIGHWVAYMNDETYVVTPSNVQFASARLDYGSAKPARLLDYFGIIEANETMDTHVAIINPYVGSPNTDIIFFNTKGEKMKETIMLAPFSICWVRLADIAKKHGMDKFRGNAKVIADHRVVPFFFFFDRAKNMYYSADHTIAWVNRQTVR